MREVYSFVQMVSRAIRFMLSEIGKGILNALIFFRVLFIYVKVNEKYSLNLLIPGIFITHTHTHTHTQLYNIVCYFLYQLCSYSMSCVVWLLYLFKKNICHRFLFVRSEKSNEVWSFQRISVDVR